MFHLILTTCFAGFVCYGGQPDISYVSAERCLEQGAILSGLARAHLRFDRVEQTSRVVCRTDDGVETTIYIGHAGRQAVFPNDALSLPVIN